MSRRNSTVTLLALALLAAPAVDAAKCKPNPKGTPWESKIIYLKFEGCADAQPTKPFDLTIGGKSIRFEQKGAYWRGEADTEFVIKDGPPLTFSLTTMRALTACTVGPEEHLTGQCVALYTIPCEEIWRLNVKTVPEDAKATIRFDRPPLPDVYKPCAGELKTAGTGTFDLRLSEQFVVNIEDVPNGPFKVPLSFRAFLGMSVLSLKEVEPRAVAPNVAVETNSSSRSLTKTQIRKALQDLLFTKQ